MNSGKDQQIGDQRFWGKDVPPIPETLPESPGLIPPPPTMLPEQSKNIPPIPNTLPEKSGSRRVYKPYDGRTVPHSVINNLPERPQVALDSENIRGTLSRLHELPSHSEAQNNDEWRTNLHTRLELAQRLVEHNPKRLKRFDIEKVVVWLSKERVSDESSIRAEYDIVTLKDPTIQEVLDTFSLDKEFDDKSVHLLKIAATRYLNYTKVSFEKQRGFEELDKLLATLQFKLDQHTKDSRSDGSEESSLVESIQDVTIHYFKDFGRSGESYDQFLQIIMTLLYLRSKKNQSRYEKLLVTLNPFKDGQISEKNAFNKVELYQHLITMLPVSTNEKRLLLKSKRQSECIHQADQLSAEVLQQLPQIYNNRRIIEENNLPKGVRVKNMPILPGNLKELNDLLPSFQILIAALSILCTVFEFRIPTEVIKKMYTNLVPQLNYLAPQYLEMRTCIETIYNELYFSPGDSPAAPGTCPYDFPLSSPDDKFL